MEILTYGSRYIKCRGQRFLSWRYYHFTIVYHKQQSDIVIAIFHFALFILLLPADNPKNQTFEKNEKKTKQKKNNKTEEVILLHKCTKNHNHMLHCSWDMACDGCNCYFSFWAIFLLLPPNSPKKWKFHTNEKNSWRCHHFTQVHQKS